MMQNEGKYLNILTEAEINALYDKPFFADHKERADYFTVPAEAAEILKILAIPSAIYFILQWAYFRISHRFYEVKFANAHTEVKFIIKHFFRNKLSISEINTPSRNTRDKIKGIILTLFKYKQVNKKEREGLVKHARKLASQHNKPKIIFKELMSHIERQSWVLPVYSAMQNIIGQAMNQEVSRLTKKIGRLIPKKTKSRIDELLATEEDFYAITELKKAIKNFSNTEIRKEIKKRDKLAEAYTFSKKLLPQLRISQGNISYYASLAEYYTPYKLKRMPKNKTYLYFLCYAYYRIQKLNDNLILSFIYRVSKYHEAAVVYGKI
jgi:hypothetical protein